MNKVNFLKYIKDLKFTFSNICNTILVKLNFFISRPLDDTKYQYASVFRKGLACFIDAAVLFAIRALLIIFYIRFIALYTDIFQDFQNNFTSQTGLKSVKYFSNTNIEHWYIFLNSKAFVYILFLLFLTLLSGVLYDMLFLTRKDASTIGRKFMKIKVLNVKTLNKLNPINILLYSFLSLFPFILPFVLIISYKTNHNLISIVSLIFIGFWYEGHIGSRKRSLHEILSGAASVKENYFTKK